MITYSKFGRLSLSLICCDADITACCITCDAVKLLLFVIVLELIQIIICQGRVRSLFSPVLLVSISMIAYSEFRRLSLSLICFLTTRRHVGPDLTASTTRRHVDLIRQHPPYLLYRKILMRTWEFFYVWPYYHCNKFFSFSLN